ncbi:phosphotransferase [Microbulbifer salipaludis]|uniref:Phosphotransferase n=1 Tax=Microbulbifer salipaludis TaxID=187980 RepID=A0ABS3E613_9GAMM|nr:choline kinase family protein [Microbulbifer salipaludis]MBN8430734.1 phosphotransferase [Microbulbifer salipaludis]
MRPLPMTLPPADILPSDWQRWSATQPTVVRPMASGLTNRSFLLNADGANVVLRWNSPISNALDLDRRTEAQSLRQASDAGLGARLIYCDPGHNYLVTGFIDGHTWKQARPGNATALAQLAALTRAIHRLPIVDSALDIHAKIARYWESIADNSSFTHRLRQLEDQVRPHIAAAQAMICSPVLCHNDLQPENLIFSRGGQLLVIDWEYACTGDPFYDLAVITEEHHLPEGKRRTLLQHYLQRPVGAGDLKRLGHWQIAYRYLSALWYAIPRTTGENLQAGLEESITALCQRLTTWAAHTGHD